MKKLEIVCDNCDASFDVLYDLGAVYRVEFCIFCGESIYDYDSNDMTIYEDDVDDIEKYDEYDDYDY
jgi:hypothetical protein